MLDTNTLFTALLTDPPGQYALTPFGSTHTVVLTGSHLFHTKGYNLFTSMGGEATREPREDDDDESIRGVTPLPPIHHSTLANTIFFCMPLERVKLALALYLHGQLYKTQGARRSVIDDEGDFVEMACDNEAALWEAAQQGACDFIVNHMPSNYRALPAYEEKRIVEEYSQGNLRGSDGDWD